MALPLPTVADPQVQQAFDQISLQHERYAVRATLPVNLKNHGTKGDGVTNDNAAVQAALTAATGGSLFVPEGRYLIDSVVIPSDTEIFGEGWGSQFVVSGLGTYPLFMPAGTVDVRLRDFAIDGNKASISGDPLVQGDPRLAIIAGGSGAAGAACERIFVDRLYVFNQKRLGIVFQNVEVGAVRDCLVEDNERDGITVYYNSENIAIQGNQINRCGDDYIGINSEDSTQLEDISVTGNICTGPGVGARGRGMTVRGGTRISIADNVFRDLSLTAIKLSDYLDSPLVDVVVNGNVIYRPGLDGAADLRGIWVSAGEATYHAGSVWAYVQNVTIADNVIRGAAEDAIKLWDQRSGTPDSDISDVTITGNRIQDGGNDGIGISSAGINDVLIASNLIKACAQDGVRCQSAAKRIHVRGNQIYRNGRYGIYFSTVSSGAISGNDIYDDLGGSATQLDGIRINALSGQFALDANNIWGNTTSAILDNGGHTAAFASQQRYGDVPTTASAATVTLPVHADFHLISGTTTITSVTAATDWKGRRITLLFADVLTLTDGSNLKLAGNFVTSFNDTITLFCDGGSWYEISRSVN